MRLLCHKYNYNCTKKLNIFDALVVVRIFIQLPICVIQNFIWNLKLHIYLKLYIFIFSLYFSALNPSVSCMSRRKLCRLLTNDEVDLKTKIKQKLKELDYTCLTADIWSTRHRSFLGVTFHWVRKQLSQHQHFLTECAL